MSKTLVMYGKMKGGVTSVEVITKDGVKIGCKGNINHAKAKATVAEVTPIEVPVVEEETVDTSMLEFFNAKAKHNRLQAEIDKQSELVDQVCKEMDDFTNSLLNKKKAERTTLLNKITKLFK